LRALSCVLGFLLPMRRFSERMASFGATVLERMTSEISRFKAMSSLGRSRQLVRGGGSRLAAGAATYKLLLVAFSICSSRAVLAEEDHQLIISAAMGARAQRWAVRAEVAMGGDDGWLTMAALGGR